MVHRRAEAGLAVARMVSVVVGLAVVQVHRMWTWIHHAMEWKASPVHGRLGMGGKRLAIVA